MALTGVLSAGWRQFLNALQPDHRQRLIEVLRDEYVDEAQDVVQFEEHARRMHYPHFREREGDVTLLANYFLEQYGEIDTGMSKSFDADVLRVLESYPWPGNVRELQNIVRRMCVLAEGTVITLRDLPAELLPKGEQLSFPATPAPIESCELTFMEAKRRYVNLFEAAYVRGVLERYAGNVSRAAEAADVDRKTFYRLLRKHHVQSHAFPARDLFAANGTGRCVVT